MAHRTSLDLTAEQPGYWPGVIDVPENQRTTDGSGSGGKALVVTLFRLSLGAGQRSLRSALDQART